MNVGPYYPLVHELLQHWITIMYIICSGRVYAYTKSYFTQSFEIRTRLLDLPVPIYCMYIMYSTTALHKRSCNVTNSKTGWTACGVLSSSRWVSAFHSWCTSCTYIPGPSTIELFCYFFLAPYFESSLKQRFAIVYYSISKHYIHILTRTRGTTTTTSVAGFISLRSTARKVYSIYPLLPNSRSYV